MAIALIVIGITVPYLIAGRAAGAGYVFGGFLVNPLDGNSYLAKMQQGAAGEWKFQLTYSPPQGDGAYLFLFYLLLGHLARITTLPLIWVFHLARVAGAVCLLVVLWRFCNWLARDEAQAAWRFFILSAVGSGLGWLAAIAAGYVSSDFWIAETYPFLSMYTNPHFPLGLALILGMSLLVFENKRGGRFILLPILSLLLAAIQPFGVVVLALPLAGFLLWHRDRILSADALASAAALVPGGLYLIYQYSTIQGDAALAIWNAQNVTLAPPAWDLLISLSPVLLLAVLGGYQCWKTKDDRGGVLLFWLVAGIVLIYLPFNLQRRFMTGLFVPAVGLAVRGMEWLTLSMRQNRWVWPVTWVVSLVTNLLLLAGGLGVSAGRDSLLYLSREEAVALGWMHGHAPAHSVVLASPEMGTFIPAWSGQNVIYGHPFESLHAEDSRRQVEAFFSGQMSVAQSMQFIDEHQVGLVFVGPRELALGGPPAYVEHFTPLYDNGGITVYEYPR